MRHRSLTNSRKHENLELRAAYRSANPYCELWPLLRKTGLIEDNRYGADIHHITGGLLGTIRYDLVPNLIHLSRAAHRFCEQFVADGLSLCCLAKLSKKPPEFEPDVFLRIMRIESFASYFSCLMPQFACGVSAKAEVERWMAGNNR